jgi:ribose transport system ATP-binding protein
MSGAEGGPADAAPALRLTHLSKTFVGTRALVDVDLSVNRGEIHALVGGNGSGKSTLIKILAGVYQADPGGTISVAGGPAEPDGRSASSRDVAADHWNPNRAFAAGMRFVHQNPGVFNELTVAENIAIGHGFPTTAGRIRWGDQRRRTQELIDRFAIRATPDAPLIALNPADRTMVAVARALQDVDFGGAGSTGVLVLDEPTSALPAADIEVLLTALRRCAAMGQTILYVSHRIDEVLSLADRVTVLRDGHRITTTKALELTESALVELIAGRSVTTDSRATAVADGAEVALELHGLHAGRLRGIDLSVRRGEVLGVAGLLGSGRSTLLRTIFGQIPIRAGSIVLNGRMARFGRPAQAIAAGISYVPEDRAREAVFSSQSVRENISAGGVKAYWSWLRLQHGRERRDAVDAMRSFLVRAASDKAPLATLSGGNQQKVVLARWLRRRPPVILLDEPTQGVDVGARQEIYELIQRSADAGAAVVVVSNDFDELVRVCGRIVVLRDGRIVGQAVAPDLDSHRLTELAYRSETTPENAA